MHCDGSIWQRHQCIVRHCVHGHDRICGNIWADPSLLMRTAPGKWSHESYVRKTNGDLASALKGHFPHTLNKTLPALCQIIKTVEWTALRRLRTRSALTNKKSGYSTKIVTLAPNTPYKYRHPYLTPTGSRHSRRERQGSIFNLLRKTGCIRRLWLELLLFAAIVYFPILLAIFVN